VNLNLPEDYTGLMPEGWSGGKAIAKWWRGKIVLLYRVFRTCAECGNQMQIDVTKPALLGTVANAGLHLKRCPACRERAKSLGTNSRPKVAGDQPDAEREAQREIQKHAFYNGVPDETLRIVNATMREELDGLYKLNRELRERLAKYEPEPKMPWE
jgi:hypothetical protein